MAFDVPYVINGSKHSARLFRRQYQNSVGAGSGVTRPDDLRVLPLNVPADGFRVMPGGGTAQSRDTTASARESYGPINDQEIVIDSVPGTGSGSGRRDLVILEITDPQMESVTYPEPSTEEGWQDGDNFARITIIQNVDSLVPASERPVKRLEQITSGAYANVTGVTLAAINYPASTSTISSAMIEDLRQVQSPRRSEVVYARPRIAGDSNDRYLSATWQSGGEYFPGGAGDPNEFQVEIPEWATHMVVDARWSSVSYNASRNPSARFWMEFGTEYRNHTWPDGKQWEFTTQQFSFGSVRSGASTDGAVQDWSLMDTRTIPAKLRGKRVTFVFKAGRHASESTSNAIWMDALGGLGCRLTFSEGLIAANLL